MGISDFFFCNGKGNEKALHRDGVLPQRMMTRKGDNAPEFIYVLCVACGARDDFIRFILSSLQLTK